MCFSRAWLKGSGNKLYERSAIHKRLFILWYQAGKLTVGRRLCSHHAGMASHATNYFLTTYVCIDTHTLEHMVSETAIQQRHFLRALLSAL